jgi:hypothetical protein
MTEQHDVQPLGFKLRLEVPDGQKVELALFTALLHYAEGMPVVVMVKPGLMLHGYETMRFIADTGIALKVAMIYVAGDREVIRSAFKAEDCGWPEVLEAARINFVQGRSPNESYVAWIKHEIAKRKQRAA